MILFSKLYENISALLTRTEEFQPNSFTQNLMISLIFSVDVSIHKGRFLNASRTISSDQPHLLKTITLASHRDFDIALLANNAIQKLTLEGSLNPIFLTISRALFKS
ncbi:hypothetical protein KIW84_014257 [Lathyrus oleraceus]|uniref:Uncharacterized protein n=1 Tax=Pisum sativum TaxID=3888 RepID=A0A9D5BMM4_PEA|nr:hypothetical protein KIW84_014257 [Pisum sativum]